MIEAEIFSSDAFKSELDDDNYKSPEVEESGEEKEDEGGEEYDPTEINESEWN